MLDYVPLLPGTQSGKNSFRSGDLVGYFPSGFTKLSYGRVIEPRNGADCYSILCQYGERVVVKADDLHLIDPVEEGKYLKHLAEAEIAAIKARTARIVDFLNGAPKKL